MTEVLPAIAPAFLLICAGVVAEWTGFLPGTLGKSLNPYVLVPLPILAYAFKAMQLP